jgi:hypothetical protein
MKPSLYNRLRFLVKQPGALLIIPGFSNRITQTKPCTYVNGVCQPDTTLTLLDTRLGNLLNVFFAIISALAVILLIWAGIQYIQSLGNADRVKAARQRIINIIIAIILLTTAYAIINLLISAAGSLAGKVQ